MNSRTQRLVGLGPAGALAILVDEPEAGSTQGTAVIAHPHPLFGGTMDNKVVQTLARAFVQCGWKAVRFNFRGVGSSEGTYDEGRGEIDDLLAVVQAQAPDGVMALAGFSFGAYVACSAAERLAPTRRVEQLVLVGTAASRFDVPPVDPGLQARTLVVHGEVDDTVPLESVMHWARPQHLPVTVIPGVEHFFHGQLPLLKSLVVRHLAAAGLHD